MFLLEIYNNFLTVWGRCRVSYSQDALPAGGLVSGCGGGGAGGAGPAQPQPGHGAAAVPPLRAAERLGPHPQGVRRALHHVRAVQRHGELPGRQRNAAE